MFEKNTGSYKGFPCGARSYSAPLNIHFLSFSVCDNVFSFVSTLFKVFAVSFTMLIPPSSASYNCTFCVQRFFVVRV